MGLSLTLNTQPESISPVYTDGIGNWYSWTGNATGSDTSFYNIVNTNLYIDLNLINQGASSSVSTNYVGRFKVPSRTGGKYVFNPENILKNYLTYPYNDSTPRYYNGATNSYTELLINPFTNSTGFTTSTGATHWDFSNFYTTNIGTSATAAGNNYKITNGVVNSPLRLFSTQGGYTLTSSVFLNPSSDYFIEIGYHWIKTSVGTPLNLSFNIGNTISSVYETAAQGFATFSKYLTSADTTTWCTTNSQFIIFATQSIDFSFSAAEVNILYASVINGSSYSKYNSLYINESTPFGATNGSNINLNTFPNFAYEMDSYTKYNMNYGLEFNPNEYIFGVTNSFTGFWAELRTGTWSTATVSTIKVGDIITISPNSALFTYYSTTASVTGVSSSGGSASIITNIVYSTTLGTSMIGYITNVQRAFGTTSNNLVYNGVRRFEEKDSSFKSLYNFDNHEDNINKSFLNDYGYDSEHCIPIQPGQGERLRFSTDFINTVGYINTYTFSGGISYSIGDVVTIVNPYNNTNDIFTILATSSTGMPTQITDSVIQSVYPKGKTYSTIDAGSFYGPTVSGRGLLIRPTTLSTDFTALANFTILLNIIDKNGSAVSNKSITYYLNSNNNFQSIFTAIAFDQINTIPIVDGYKYKFSTTFNISSIEIWYIGQVPCDSNLYTNYRIKFLNKQGTWCYWNFQKDNRETNNITRTEYRTPLSYDYSLNPSTSGYRIDKLRGSNLLTINEQKTFTLNSDWIDQDAYAYLVDNLLPTRQAFIFYDSYSFSDGTTATSVNIPIIITDNSAYKKTINRDKLFNMTINYKYAEMITQNI